MSQSSIANILDYVDAAKDSSDRGRLLLLVIITASVLTFAAFWNSRPSGWITERLHLARLAALGCPCDWDDQKCPSTKPEIAKEIRELDIKTRALFNQSHAFFNIRQLHSCGDVTILAQELEHIRSEQVNFVKVPFFGIAFDVNDLGILGGFSFVVVLLWFRFSLARELSNLNLAFGVARAENREVLQACYDLLAMRQVLTVPPIRFTTPLSDTKGFWEWLSLRLKKFHHPGFWGNLPLALYFLPLAVHSLVMENDFRTWRYGWTVSHTSTSVLFACNIVFFIIIVILTCLCLILSNEINKVWKEVGRELGSQEP